MGRCIKWLPAEQKCVRAGHNRWSKLVHQRIANHMKVHLGTEWETFTQEALRLGKPLFIDAFATDNMWCRGPLVPCGLPHGHMYANKCPHGRGQGTSPSPGKIHGDHTIDLNNICTSWLKAQTFQPTSWRDGINVQKLLNSLFKFAPDHLVFRCEDCHSSKPHYDTTITPADMAASGTSLNPIVL